MNDLGIAIKKTIDYHKKYNFKLNKNDLILRLISNKLFTQKNINNHLDHHQYCLSFQNSNKYQNEKLALAKKYLDKLKNNKNILFIGITGSVAGGKPKPDDDIDWLIVTKKDKVWVSRIEIKINLWLNRIPHRHFGEKEKGDQICLNLWLDESALCLPKSKQKLKNAMDLILIKPLLDRRSIYKKMLKENLWAKKYVANGYTNLVRKFKVKSKKIRKNNNLLIEMVNYLLFKLQYWYMKPKLKKEVINLRQAFFHPRG